MGGSLQDLTEVLVVNIDFYSMLKNLFRQIMLPPKNDVENCHILEAGHMIRIRKIFSGDGKPQDRREESYRRVSDT